MFPTTGSFHGPGGRFKIEWLVLDLFHSLTTMKVKSKNVNSIGKEKACCHVPRGKYVRFFFFFFVHAERGK